MANGIKHNGWCPKDRVAEDGFVPSCYNLRESDSESYPERTRKNVMWGDATVVFSKREMGKGSALTVRIAAKADKPCLVLYTDQPIDVNSRALAEWLVHTNPGVLNVAGSRESSEPGTYTYVGHVLQSGFSYARSASPADPFVRRTY